MARIVLGSYAVRFPLGGYLSWVLQWLVGFQRLGHAVTFVEKAGWRDACYDPRRDVMSDDCSYGVRALDGLLGRFGLDRDWCFVDVDGRYHGLDRAAVEGRFSSADVFVDMGTHGGWLEEAAPAGLRVLVDGEPGTTQIRMEAGQAGFVDRYDRHFTVGANIGTDRSTAPTGGRSWRHVFYPVVPELFSVRPADPSAPFTTVMSWHAYDPVEFEGRAYGQKDVEFEKFADLPRLTRSALELAITGKELPLQRLRTAGWRVRDAHEVSLTFDSYLDYMAASRGEFSVCKEVFVATRSGWFGDRAAAYLASGRPVVMQETGFSEHLPCGRGLFAVETVEEAAEALEAVEADYRSHSQAAREIALEQLDAAKVLPRFLEELGL